MLPNQKTITILVKDGLLIPKGAEIEQVTVFAGKGDAFGKEFRDAPLWNKKYGLPDSEIKNWYRSAGLVIGNTWVYDVHSFIHDDLGIVKMKITNIISRKKYEKQHKKEQEKYHRKLKKQGKIK